MPDGYPDDAVIVSQESFDSDDPYAVIQSNSQFVADQFEEHLTPGEVSTDALRSYHVHGYELDVGAGGISQFVFSSRWEPLTIESVREGLKAMGAVKNFLLFEPAARILDRLGPEQHEEFFESENFGEQEDRDIFNEFHRSFEALDVEENLAELNSRWLRQLPNLVVLSADDMQAELNRRADAIPDRKERVARAMASEPRFTKLIRALCTAAGHELDRVNSGGWNAHKGRWVLAWYFVTDKGHHYMIDAGHKASMFAADSDKRICEIEASAEFGEYIDVQFEAPSRWSRFMNLFGGFLRKKQPRSG